MQIAESLKETQEFLPYKPVQSPETFLGIFFRYGAIRVGENRISQSSVIEGNLIDENVENRILVFTAKGHNPGPKGEYLDKFQVLNYLYSPGKPIYRIFHQKAKINGETFTLDMEYLLYEILYEVVQDLLDHHSRKLSQYEVEKYLMTFLKRCFDQLDIPSQDKLVVSINEIGTNETDENLLAAEVLGAVLRVVEGRDRTIQADYTKRYSNLGLLFQLYLSGEFADLPDNVKAKVIRWYNTLTSKDYMQAGYIEYPELEKIDELILSLSNPEFVEMIFACTEKDGHPFEVLFELTLNGSLKRAQTDNPLIEYLTVYAGLSDSINLNIHRQPSNLSINLPINIPIDSGQGPWGDIVAGKTNESFRQLYKQLMNFLNDEDKQDKVMSYLGHKKSRLQCLIYCSLGMWCETEPLNLNDQEKIWYWAGRIIKGDVILNHVDRHIFLESQKLAQALELDSGIKAVDAKRNRITRQIRLIS